MEEGVIEGLLVSESDDNVIRLVGVGEGVLHGL